MYELSIKTVYVYEVLNYGYHFFGTQQAHKNKVESVRKLSWPEREFCSGAHGCPHTLHSPRLVLSQTPVANGE